MDNTARIFSDSDTLCWKSLRALGVGIHKVWTGHFYHMWQTNFWSLQGYFPLFRRVLCIYLLLSRAHIGLFFCPAFYFTTLSPFILSCYSSRMLADPYINHNPVIYIIWTEVNDDVPVTFEKSQILIEMCWRTIWELIKLHNDQNLKNTLWWTKCLLFWWIMQKISCNRHFDQFGCLDDIRKLPKLITVIKVIC